MYKSKAGRNQAQRLYRRRKAGTVPFNVWWPAIPAGLRQQVSAVVEAKFGVKLLQPRPAKSADTNGHREPFQGQVTTPADVAALVVPVEDPTAGVCLRVLAENPRVTQLRFEKLAMDRGVARRDAREWLRHGVAVGTIDAEPNEDGALMHTLRRKKEEEA